MAEQKKDKKNSINIVEIEGFLKENTLKKETTTSGRDYIGGSLTVALSEEEDFKVRFIAFKTNSNGGENKFYTNLEALLPEKNLSIATLLASNVGATFNEVKWRATKIWIRGQFETYDKKNTKNEIQTFVTVRGMTAGVKDEQSKNPFTPKAKFDVEGYVDSIKIDKKAEENGTQKTIVNLLIPDYFAETVIPVDFVCDTPSAINSIASYHKGDTGRFVGTLRNIKQENRIKGETLVFMDGTEEDKSKITYTFINERVIEKMVYPYVDSNPRYITVEEVKKMLFTRQEKLEELQISPDKSSAEARTSTNKSFVKGFEI